MMLGHLPVLDANRLAEQRVRVQRDVAGAVHALRRQETFVNPHAPFVDGEAERSRHLEVGIDADGDQHHVRLFAAPVRERHPGDATSVAMPLLDRGGGAHVNSVLAVDGRVHVAHFLAQSTREGYGRRLDHQDFLAELSCRSAHLGADETGADQEQPLGSLERVAERLAVAQRAKREHVVGIERVGQPARRTAGGQHQRAKRDLGAALQRQRPIPQRSPDHSLLEPDLDLLFRVLGLIVQEHLRQLDLASKELFGKVGPIVRPVAIGAQDHHVAVVAFLAQRERRSVPAAAATHDDDRLRGHFRPPCVSPFASAGHPTAQAEKPWEKSSLNLQGRPSLAIDFPPHQHLRITLDGRVTEEGEEVEMRTMTSSARALAARAGAVALAMPMLLGGAVPASAPVLAHAMTPAIGSGAQYEPLGTAEDMGIVHFGCQLASPPTCYGPDQIYDAYNIKSVLEAGFTGTGRTIVIIDAFQSPTLLTDLARFDFLWNLPAPTLNVIVPWSPTNTPTPFDPQDGSQVNWSAEISIDVEWAHAIAPGAAIDLVLAKSAADADMLSVTKYAIDRNLGDVISQSFGEAERCADPQLIQQEHALFGEASDKGITLFASSGDQGAAQQTCDGSSFSSSASTPASDPDVTAVGGTRLTTAGTNGAYQSESAWSTGLGATGGGFSAI